MKVEVIRPYNSIKLCRHVEVGEIFDISKERYEQLTGKNKQNKVYVKKIEEVEIAKKVVKSEKAIKKTVKKSKE